MPTEHLLRSRWRLLLLVLLVGVMAAAAASQGTEPARAVVPGPVMVANPASGAPGDAVQLSGAGFTPNATLTARFFSAFTGIVHLGSFPANADGTFTFDTSVPVDAEPGGTAGFSVENAGNPEEAASVPFEVTEGDIGDEGPKPSKPEFCKVTITLVSVKVTSNNRLDGEVVPVRVDTLPASKAPGSSVQVEPVVGDDATQVGEVAREYFLPKKAFPHRVLISAKIPRTFVFGLFSRAYISDPAKPIVVCPDSRDVEVVVEALFAGLGDTFTMKYHIEVAEADAE